MQYPRGGVLVFHWVKFLHLSPPRVLHKHKLVAGELKRQCSGYERFTFDVADVLHKSMQGAAAQFILQPQYADNPQNICEGVITNALQSCSVRNSRALNVTS